VVPHNDRIGKTRYDRCAILYGFPDARIGARSGHVFHADAMRAERNRRGFKAEPRACAGLEEQQRNCAPEHLLARRKPGLEVIRGLTEIIDIVDCKITCAQ
jgi:hypothetical protein